MKFADVVHSGWWNNSADSRSTPCWALVDTFGTEICSVGLHARPRGMPRGKLTVATLQLMVTLLQSRNGDILHCVL